MSTFAALFEAEAQQAALKATPPKTPKTDTQAQGIADLDTMIGQMQTNLQDVKPGTPMYARLTRDLAEAQKQRAQYGGQPTPAEMPGPSKGSFADLFEAAARGEGEPSTKEGTMGAYVPRRPVSPLTKIAAEIPTPVKTAATDLASQFGELRRKLGASTASLADVVVGDIPASLAGLATYGGARALGQTPEEAATTKQSVVQVLEKPLGRMLGVTQEPAYQQEMSRRLMDFVGENIGKGAQWIADKTGLPVQDVENMIGTGMVAAPAGVKAAGQVAKPAVQAVAKPIQQAMAELEGRAPVQGQVMTPQAVQQMQAQFAAKQPGAPMVGMGAAMTTDANMIRAALTQASPELQRAVSSIPFDKVNLPTLQRHIEADQLPIPVRLTEGQATGDVVKLSREQNRRGVDPALAQRFNEQNGQLVENLNAIKERAAPDVYSTRTIDNSQALIDAYKALDDTRSGQISAAYKALTDANGGQFPVDGARIAKNSETALAKQLKSDFVPTAIAKQLERFKTEQMTFEQFEALRTNIAAEMRKAERAGDGNAAAALSIVRNQMEALPLSGTAAASLKPLADQARSLAKARFDALKADPAYKAAVMDSVPADKFMDKFVIKGINKNINRMIDTFGRDSVPVQEMRAGVINHLRERAGIIDDQGNFSQAGYNKALKGMDSVKNMDAIFDPDSNQMLKSLGNVARYTQAQPKGSFVNNSNTLVAGLAERAAGLAETGANVVFGQQLHGLPVGTILRQGRKNIIERQETKRSLELGAGTKVEK